MATRLKFDMMPIVLLCSVVILLVGSCLIEVGAHPAMKLGHPYWQNTSLEYSEAGRAEGERGLSFVEEIITTEISSELDSPRFGNDLALTDSVLVVGSEHIGGFVYEKEGSSWVFRKRLYHTLPEWWDSLSTNGLVIVALVCFSEYEYSCDKNSGKVLIFERGTDSWNLAQVALQDLDENCILRYCSVLVNGSTLSAITIFVSDATTSTIQLFRKSGENWDRRQTLSESGRIGECAAHGDYLVTTNHRTDINGNIGAGVGVLFKLNGIDFERLIYIESPFASQHEAFGLSVSLNDRWLAVRALKTVYMFERNGDDFSFSQQLTPLNPFGCDYDSCEYVRQAKISGDFMAVSKPNEPMGDLSSVGKVYIYVLDSGTWVLTETLQASSLEHAMNFGSGLGFAWDVIAVGAPGRDSQNGAIYLESFVRTPVPIPTPTPTATPTPSLSLSPSPSPSPSLPPIPGPVTETPTWSRAPVTATPTLSQAPVTQTPTWSRAPVTQSPTTNPGPVTEAPSPIVTLNPDVSHTPTESQKSDPDSKSFPIGAVVGGVVGGLAVIAIVVAGVMIWMKKSHASNDNTSAGPTMEQDAADGSTTGLNNVNAVDEESQPSAFEVLLQPRDDPVLLPAGYDLAFADDTLPEPNMDVSLPYMGNAGSGR